MAGNRCDYLTITSSNDAPLPKNFNPNIDKKPLKKGVVFSARVHPGETNGSWMMKGAIDFLSGNSEEALALRDMFVFKIIPMLNPDGVINGNYRCSLAGSDLNRKWKTPNKILHPVIYNAKRFIKTFAAEYDIELICDFHGHSRKKNVFMYGNNVIGKPEATRLFPYILSKISPWFNFKDCRFKV